MKFLYKLFVPIFFFSLFIGWNVLASDIFVTGADSVWSPDIAATSDDTISSSDSVANFSDLLITGADNSLTNLLYQPGADVTSSSDSQTRFNSVLVTGADAVWSPGVAYSQANDNSINRCIINVPYFAPISQSVFGIEQTSFFIEVSNPDSGEEIVNLSVSSNDSIFSPEYAIFSENPVTLPANGSKLIRVDLDTGFAKLSNNPIFFVVKGSSSGYSCEQEATLSIQQINYFQDNADDAGVFYVKFSFMNRQPQEKKISFNFASDFEYIDQDNGQLRPLLGAQFAKKQLILVPNIIGSNTVFINPIHDGGLNGAHAKILFADGDNGALRIEIPIELIDYASLNNYNVFSTNFNPETDSYNFYNSFDEGGYYFKGYAGGYCYGMAATSLLYYKKELLLPSGKTVSDLSKENAMKEIALYQGDYNNCLTDAYWDIVKSVFDGNDSNDLNVLSSYAYGNIKASLSSGNPALVGLSKNLVDFYQIQMPSTQGHEILAYKIIEDNDNNKSYIFVYDPNYSLAFRIVEFDLKNFKFEPYGEYNVFYPMDKPVKLAFINETKERVVEFINSTMENVKSFGGKVRALIGFSPINFIITNDAGEVIDSLGKSEIPGASFSTIDGDKVFYIPDNMKYKVKINAYDKGVFTLVLAEIENGYYKFKIFNDIPVEETTVANYEIGNFSDNLLAVDQDGDGIFEGNYYASSIFYGGNLLDYVEVTKLEYAGADILAGATTAAGDGVAPLTLAELKEAPVDIQQLAGGKLGQFFNKKLKIKLKMAQDMGNEFQGRTENIKFNFLAKE